MQTKPQDCSKESRKKWFVINAPPITYSHQPAARTNLSNSQNSIALCLNYRKTFDDELIIHEIALKLF